MNLSARDLRAVVALIEERNFTRAAARCHLSQPAFSTLISGVEQALGARLFERSTRSVEPTPEARLIEPAARRLLSDLDGMVADFRDHAQRRKGRVVIAALPSLAAGWLPGALGEFRDRHPGIDIELFDTLSDACLALVRSGRADIALASAGPQEDDLQTELLCTDGFHLVCRGDHPLAQARTVKASDLAPWPFVHLSRTSSVRQYLDAALHPTPTRVFAEVEHIATVAGLVQAGLGITVVPALTLFHFERPQLAVRPLALRGLVRRLYVVRSRVRPLSAAAQALHALLLERRPRVTAAGGRSGGALR